MAISNKCPACGKETYSATECSTAARPCNFKCAMKEIDKKQSK